MAAVYVFVPFAWVFALFAPTDWAKRHRGELPPLPWHPWTVAVVAILKRYGLPVGGTVAVVGLAWYFVIQP